MPYLYVPDKGSNFKKHQENQLLLDTMQQGILYGIFSALVIKKIRGKDAMERYMNRVYKKLTHDYPEYFIMLRKIENNEWESIFLNWMGIAENEKETKK